MMDVPEDYDDNSKYCKTHPKLWPPDDKENLDHNGSSTRPQQSSRSVLGKVGNQDILPGVLKHNSQNFRFTRNPVTWADRVYRNL